MAGKKQDDKLSLTEILYLIDMGERGAWAEFTDEEKKSVNFWLLNRYISSLSSTSSEEENAIIRVNEVFNKNFGAIGMSKDVDHKELQWRLLAMCGDYKRKKFHPWIKLNTTKKDDSNIIDILTKIYPNMKHDEVQTIAKISTEDELRELAKEHGFSGVKFG
jgi:hypothetical protein